MRIVIAAFTVLSMSGISWADTAATRLKIEKARSLLCKVIARCVSTPRRHAVSAARRGDMPSSMR